LTLQQKSHHLITFRIIKNRTDEKQTSMMPVTPFYIIITSYENNFKHILKV